MAKSVSSATGSATAHVHVCLLGPSGIGKSPLAALFKLPGFDPYRVRKPRDEKDRLVCKSNEEAHAIYRQQKLPAADWPSTDAPEGWFHLGSHWLFFNVGSDKQCLQFKDEKGEPLLASPKRIEIFAPRLVDILNDKCGSGKAIGLSADNLVVIVLNPTPTRYSKMSGKPDKELRQATFYNITKRTELQRKPVDLPDAQKRVRRITRELAGYATLETMAPAYVECTSWKHSELRYHQPDHTRWDARRELLLARERILAELSALSSRPAVKQLLASGVIRSVSEIVELDDII